MSKLNTALFFYAFLFVVILFFGSLSNYQPNELNIPILVILPLVLYFLFSFFIKLKLINKNAIPLGNLISTLFNCYGFILSTIMTAIGFISARDMAQITSAVLFLPITIYFFFNALPKRKKAIVLPEIIEVKKKMKPAPDDVFEILPEKSKRLDQNRRQFLKLIGSAGLSLFLFAVLTKKAQASFFGSVPGPGTVAIKDSAGTIVDPAIKHPTDGYRINQVDDSSPAYYGFMNRDSAWFIMKEDSSGNYRYTKGSSNFSTNWTNRASLTYDYFDAIF